MDFDTLELKFLIKKKYKRQKDLAKELHITGTSLGNKLNNRTPFTADDIYNLVEKLDIKQEDVGRVFFTKKS